MPLDPEGIASRLSVTAEIGARMIGGATMVCADGRTVTGGGFTTESPTQVALRSSGPAGNGWTAIVHNTSDASITISVFAICGEGS